MRGWGSIVENVEDRRPEHALRWVGAAHELLCRTRHPFVGQSALPWQACLINAEIGELGVFRVHLAQVAAKHDLDIADDLAAIMPASANVAEEHAGGAPLGSGRTCHDCATCARDLTLGSWTSGCVRSSLQETDHAPQEPVHRRADHPRPARGAKPHGARKRWSRKQGRSHLLAEQTLERVPPEKSGEHAAAAPDFRPPPSGRASATTRVDEPERPVERTGTILRSS